MSKQIGLRLSKIFTTNFFMHIAIRTTYHANQVQFTDTRYLGKYFYLSHNWINSHTDLEIVSAIMHWQGGMKKISS